MKIQVTRIAKNGEMEIEESATAEVEAERYASPADSKPDRQVAEETARSLFASLPQIQWREVGVKFQPEPEKNPNETFEHFVRFWEAKAVRDSNFYDPVKEGFFAGFEAASKK